MDAQKACDKTRATIAKREQQIEKKTKQVKDSELNLE